MFSIVKRSSIYSSTAKALKENDIIMRFGKRRKVAKSARVACESPITGPSFDEIDFADTDAAPRFDFHGRRWAITAARRNSSEMTGFMGKTMPAIILWRVNLDAWAPLSHRARTVRRN
jgi:hypothetical protein